MKRRSIRIGYSPCQTHLKAQLYGYIFSDNYTSPYPIVFQSFAHVMRDASLFTRMGVNVLIKNTNTQPLVEMSAKEFMFGYQSTLLTLGNKFMPSWIGFDKLGLIDRVSRTKPPHAMWG